MKNVDGIKADPPKVFSAPAPGDPASTSMASRSGARSKDVDLRYAVNTNWDLFEHTPRRRSTLRYNDIVAAGHRRSTGPWTPARASCPTSFSKLPADDNWKDVKAAAARQEALVDKTMPKSSSAPTPAELIVLDGPASYLAVEGAPTLLWVNNTEATCSAWAQTGDFYFLVAGPLVQGREPRRPVDVRHADPAGRLQEDPGRASALARARVRAGHAAGDRGGAAGDDSAHRARQQERAEGA